MIAIGLWKLAFGDRKRLLVPEMLSANTPWCIISTTILNKLNKIEIANAKTPPILATLAILSTPRLAANVTTKMNSAPSIPTTSVDEKCQKCQLWVLSDPNSIVDTETIKKFVDETNQMIHDASQINVPINANFSFVEPRNHE